MIYHLEKTNKQSIRAYFKTVYHLQEMVKCLLATHHSIVVTNIDPNSCSLKSRYCLYLTPKEITYVLKNTISKQKITLNLESMTMMLNDESQSLNLLDVLYYAVKSTLKDVKTNKAFIYETAISRLQ